MIHPSVVMLTFFALACLQARAQNTYHLLFSPELPPQIRYSSSFNDSVSVQLELQSVLLQLSRSAYHFSSLDSSKWSGTTLKAFVYLGEQYPSVRIDCADLRYSGLVPYPNIAAVQRQAAINAANIGYPFAASRFDSIFVENKTLHFCLRVTKGDFYRFDSIRIESQYPISEKMIGSMIGIKPQMPFQQSLLDDLEQKIDQLPFLKSQKPYQLHWSPNKAKLLLFLEKKAANRFDGYLGLLPSSESQNTKPQLIGEANLLLLDLLHLSETLSLQWKRPSSLSQKMQLSEDIPYIWGSQLAEKASLEIAKRDSTSLNIGLRLELALNAGWNRSYGLFLDYRKSTVLLKQPSEAVSNSSMLLYGFSYKWTWNHKNNSTKLNVSIAGGERNNGTTKKETTIDTQLTMATEQVLIKSLSTKLSTQGEWMFSGAGYSENEMLRIGGLRNLRGFAEESIPCSGYIVPSADLRYKLPGSSVVYAFYDRAFYLKQSKEEKTQDKASSLGIGLELGTKSGLFSLVYAIGRNDNTPFKWMEGVVHIGFANRF